MSLTIYEPSRILNSNISTNTIQTFFDVTSSRTFINGSVGIGTNQPLANLHIENNGCPFKINIANENKTKSITYQTYYGLLPVGSIIIIPTVRLMTFLTNQGWLECNGTTYNRTQYPLLEPLLRDTDYGNTTGVNNTFKVPNLNDRIPVGSGGSYNQAYYNTNASKTITLNIQQLPNHSHSGTSFANTQLGSHTHTLGDLSVLNTNMETNTCCGGHTTTGVRGSTTNNSTQTNIHIHDPTYGDAYNGGVTLSIQRNTIFMIYMIKAK